MRDLVKNITRIPRGLLAQLRMKMRLTPGTRRAVLPIALLTAAGGGAYLLYPHGSKGLHRATEAEETVEEEATTAEAHPLARGHKKHAAAAVGGMFEHAGDLLDQAKQTIVQTPSKFKRKPAEVHPHVDESTEVKRSWYEGINVINTPAISGSEMAAKDKNVCVGLEYRGDGFQRSQLTQKDWMKIVELFRESKQQLIAWAQKHRKEFPDRNVEGLEATLRDLKIIRPPSIEEPDLSWRGIGVWTRDDSGSAALRLGGGFIKLLKKAPKRAAFEMTRLVAQTWSPCELQRSSVNTPWQPLLRCLDLSEDEGCAAGSYSESGWAVSSTIAASVTPPGCRLPMYSNPKYVGCLKRIPLPMSLTQKDVPNRLPAEQEDGS